MATRTSKTITDPKLLEQLYNLTEDDITMSFIMDTFGEFDGKVKARPYDLITIPTGKYGNGDKKNKEPFTTTVGLWVFNKYFIERDLMPFFDGYITKSIDKGMFGDIQDVLATALTEGKITTEILDRYLLKTQKMMPYVNTLSPSFTQKMLTCTSAINKKKEELFKKYEKELEEKPEIYGTKIEEELIAYAKEYLGDDPAMDMFLSGARGSFGNNFKNMFLMKGVVRDDDPNAKKKYMVAKSNYIDGISPEEYSTFAKALVAGPYSRSNKTAIGGYQEKLLLTALQHLVIGPPGSDCGTEHTITVTLDKKSINNWIYCFIKEGSKLVEITSENKEKYIGKTVKMRAACMCKKREYICEKCMGTLFNRIGRPNVGLLTTNVGSIRKNISMKSFHDSVQKLHEMDLDLIFGYK